MFRIDFSLSPCFFVCCRRLRPSSPFPNSRCRRFLIASTFDEVDGRPRFENPSTRSWPKSIVTRSLLTLSSGRTPSLGRR